MAVGASNGQKKTPTSNPIGKKNPRVTENITPNSVPKRSTGKDVSTPTIQEAHVGETQRSNVSRVSVFHQLTFLTKK